MITTFLFLVFAYLFSGCIIIVSLTLMFGALITTAYMLAALYYHLKRFLRSIKDKICTSIRKKSTDTKL